MLKLTTYQLFLDQSWNICILPPKKFHTKLIVQIHFTVNVVNTDFNQTFIPLWLKKISGLLKHCLCNNQRTNLHQPLFKTNRNENNMFQVQFSLSLQLNLKKYLIKEVKRTCKYWQIICQIMLSLYPTTRIYSFQPLTDHVNLAWHPYVIFQSSIEYFLK